MNTLSIRPGSVDSAAGALGKSDRVARRLESEIRAGRPRLGEQLESEHALMRRFGVSRTTVRRSLRSLAERGLIATRAGIGSFVTYDGRMLDNEVGWSRALADAGARVDTRLLRAEILEDRALAARIGLDDPWFVAVDRLRVLTDEEAAISLEQSRLPLTPELAEVPLRGLRDCSLHETMRAANLFPDHGEERADLHRLALAEAEVLGHPAGAPFLRTQRLVRDRKGAVIEHVISLLDPAHFALQLEF